MQHRPLPHRYPSEGLFVRGILALFALYMAYCILAKRVPVYVFGIYLFASLFTFVAYWRDKRAAQADNRRTPENKLHLLGLLCGWPGALIAQQMFRHKTAKLSFQWVFMATCLLNVTAFVLYSSPEFVADILKLF